MHAVADECAVGRKWGRKVKLCWCWRASSDTRRAMRWIQFKGTAIRYHKGHLFIGHMALSLWDSYGLPNYELRAHNINEGSHGRWHINICVKASPRQGPRCADATRSVGIDLGLKGSPR